MHFVKMRFALCVLAIASVASAQESGIHVRSIRVLATDPEAVATFYEKAFGMSETRRAANTATFRRSSSTRVRPLTRRRKPRRRRS